MYDCCEEDEEDSKGCAKVCKKCGGSWGSGANGCHEKEHNAVEEGRRPSARLRRPRISSPWGIALQLSDLVPARRSAG